MEEITEDGQGTRPTKHPEGIEKENIFNLNKTLGVINRTPEAPFVEAGEQERGAEEVINQESTPADWTKAHYDKVEIIISDSMARIRGI